MKADKVIGIILIAFSAIMYYQANHLPPPLFGDVGAAFVPKIWFAILGFCGAVLTVTGIVKDRKSRVSGTDKVAEVGFQKSTIAFFTHYKYVISGFIIFFAFISLMNYIGYFVSSLRCHELSGAQWGGIMEPGAVLSYRSFKRHM